MAANDFPLIPGNPRNVILRPLDKGVILHMPPQSLPAGAFLEAKGVSVNPAGLTRRPVFRYYGNSLSAFPYPPLQNLQMFWNIAGAQKAIAWDQKFIYLVTSDAVTGIYWKYGIGTISVSGTTVTGAGGANWTESSFELQAGDVIVLDADGSGDGPEAIEIASITDATHLETVTAAVGTYAGGTDYEIRRAFDADEPFMVDYAVVPGTANKMVFADGSRFLYAYDGSTFNDFKSTYSYIPRAVSYFQDRVWIGNITESSEEHKQGIRWSNVFPNIDTFSSGDIVDLPYQQGELMRLVPMGFYLMAYFKDRVFLGRRSNKVGLPLQFDPMETGAIGLAGTRAVIPWIGGHFFLGQDNVYWLTINGVDPEGIGTPIVRESIKQCDQLWRVYGVHYPEIDSILFAFPKNGDDFERVWLFNYRSKSWSEWPLTGQMISVGSISDVITYSNWVNYPDYDTGRVYGTASGTTLTLAGGGNFTTGPGWAIAAGDKLHIIAEQPVTIEERMDRKDCESTTPPMVKGQTVPVLYNATWARSADFKHGGSYSYKLTKTIAAGTAAYAMQVDDGGTSTLNNFVPGRSYRFGAWLYVPTASGIQVGEVYLRTQQYANGAWTGEPLYFSGAKDTWLYQEMIIDVDPDATHVDIEIVVAAAASLNEYFYIDDFSLWEEDDTVTTYTVASKTDDTHLEISETFAYTFSDKRYSLVEKNSTYAALSKYDSYQQIQPAAPTEKILYMGRDGYLFYFQSAGTYDEGGAGVPVQLTTGDMDFGMPDSNKIWNRLSLKTDDSLDEEVRFRVYFSEDRGRNWKSIGTLVIPQYGDEGYITFRSTASLGRFRLVSESRVEPYTITELVLRVKPLGQEVPTR